MVSKNSSKKIFSYKTEKRPSIRLQVFVAVITLTALAMVVSFSGRNQRALTQLAADQFNQQQLILARSAAVGIERFVADVNAELFILSNFSVIQSMDPGILERMKIIYSEIPLQTSLRRLDKNGILRFIYPNEGWRKEVIGRDCSGEIYFQKAKENKNTFLSGLVINEAGQKRLRVAMPIYSEGEKGVKEFNGAMVWSFDPKTLDSLYLSPIVSGETGYAWLINEEGIFLSHYEKEFVGQNAFKARMETNSEFSYETINNIQWQMMTGEEGVNRYISGWHRGQSGKIEKFIAYAPVRVFDKIWSVAVCAPVAEVKYITKKARYNELYTLCFTIFILTAAGVLFFVVFYRWSQSLKQEVEARKQTEKRITHLNGILKAIRNVNQLVVKEKDCEKLLQNVCGNLVETGRYQGAWIILVKENGTFITSAHAGIETGFSEMIDKLKSGKMMRCTREAIEQSGIAVVTNPAVECSGCPLAVSGIDKTRMVACLKYKDCFYGFFSVIAPPGMNIDEEEKSLIDEIAGDVSFALYAIDVEAERKQAAEALKESGRELREAYTKLKQTQTQLIQAEKMEAIGRMASGVAHEVKNPLGIILQGIYFLEKELIPGQKESREVIQMVRNSVERADGIINALVDFSKTTELKLKSENIDSVLEDSLELIQHSIKLQSIEIVEELEKNLPKVLVDKRKIEQVFINIFLNAIQAMPDGGKLFIRFYSIQQKKTNNRLSEKDMEHFKFKGNAVVVEIEDTGAGIPEENLNKLFEPFFTTKGPKGGTGLGLSVTKSIIDTHKGFIEIKSEIGKGAKVIIVLMAAEEG